MSRRSAKIDAPARMMLFAEHPLSAFGGGIACTLDRVSRSSGGAAVVDDFSFPVGDEFGDHELFHEVSGLGDRLDQCVVVLFGTDILDEAAVDLDAIEWQILQVGIGGKAAAEVIQ